MGSSRYDRTRPVSGQELDEARALHTVAYLVMDYPGITDSAVAGQVAQVLHAAANEIGNGRALPIEVRRTVRALANALREDMQPADDTSGPRRSNKSARVRFRNDVLDRSSGRYDIAGADHCEGRMDVDSWRSRPRRTA